MMQTNYYNVNGAAGAMIDLCRSRQSLAMTQMESGLWLYEDKPRQQRRSRQASARRSELSELLSSSAVLAVTIAGTVLAMCL